VRYLLPFLLLLSVLATLPGCEPKADVLTTDSSAQLEFSADTVLFDTVFVQTGTATRRLWVYNRNPRAVRVEQITLATPAGSPYHLVVGGDAGTVLNNVEIRGKDSLLVLVRATIDPSPAADKPFLVSDDLRFRTNGNDQNVKLVAYGQNAYFHDGTRLPCNAVWTNDKPHVIYNSVLVDSACTLTVQPGTRVYSHAGSVLVVGGSLRVNADYQPTAELKPDDQNIVRFAADRLESFYDNVPGQWGGIVFLASSHDNVVRYAEIKNASFGLFILNVRNRQPRPAVQVEQTVIRNISGERNSFASQQLALPGSGGVLSYSGDVRLTNCLLTNCGDYAVLSVGGGLLDMRYCTVANYTNVIRRDQTASITVSNLAPSAVAKPPYSVTVQLQNCIVWGGLKDELYFDKSEEYQQLTVRNNLLRSELYRSPTSQPGKPGLGAPALGNLIVTNDDHLFRYTPNRPGPDNKYDFRLDTLSPASNQAVPLPGISADLLNVPRDAQRPDLGAYERKNP